jgi:hypothetical protein
MTSYITKNSEYPVEKIGEWNAIRCLKGPTAGRPYAVLGSIDPEKHKIGWMCSGMLTLPYVDKIPFSEGTFREFTDKDVRKGSQIVSILIDESNGKLAWEKFGDLMLTSSVQEIRE